MIKLLERIGDYFIMMRKVISKPMNYSIFIKQINLEFGKIGMSSIGIVLIISIFIGAVVTIQQYLNISDPLIAQYYIGLATREAIILEFSPTMIALILAGKVGSNIASEIGTMRTTEQIDALGVMGINPASFLILPKIIAAIYFFPILVTLSIAIGLLGGWMGGISVGVLDVDFIKGLQTEFTSFYITYCMIKTIVFAFIEGSGCGV